MSLDLSAAEAAQLSRDIERWRDDPVAFVTEVFGAGYERETGAALVLDAWQRDFLGKLLSPRRRVAAKAAKGVGKTAALAWVAWWFLLTRRHVKAACCSITGDNLDDGLWTELALWRRRSPLLDALFAQTGGAIESKDHPETWWLSKRAFPRDADKSAQAETLAGLHADAILILLDEVGSYPSGVFAAAKAIFNVVGADALLVVAGNCTDVDGPLYRLCTEEADAWEVVSITGDPDDPQRSSRVDIEVARAEIARYGREDPVVMVNILGKFPPKGGSKLLSLDEVTAAMHRDSPQRLWAKEARIWGLDCATTGMDRSLLYKRQGPVAFIPRTWRNLEPDQLADKVALEVADARRAGKGPHKVFVDMGGVGRGTYSRLRSLLGDLVEGVDFGSSALDDAQYANRRTEMWCVMAEWVRTHGCLPDRPELRTELTAPSVGEQSTTSKGTRRMLESKESLAKRGHPSPDEGDALALTFAAPVLAPATEALHQRHAGRAATDFDPIAHLRGGEEAERAATDFDPFERS